MSPFKIRRTASLGFVRVAITALMALPLAAQVQLPVQLPAPPDKTVPKVAPKPSATPAKPPSEPPRTTTAPAPAPNHPATTPTGPAATPARPATTPTRPAVPAGPPRTPGHVAPAPGMNRSRPGETITRTPRGEVTRSPRGEVRVIRTRGMDIHYGQGGAKKIVRERADGSVAVSNRYGDGYIQHPYSYRGTTIVQRTYYVNGGVSGRIYQPYTFGGVGLNVYAPAYYYPTPLYGWAYYGWGAPVAYSWGWTEDPWYGYYGVYFTPYPVYASPSLWLTDYLMSQTLQAAYLEHAAELSNAQASYTPITPDIKQQIADEVRRQITLESSEARAGTQTPPDPGSSGIARMLSDNTAHIFVVSASLDVQSNAGACWITEGDVLRLSPGALPDSSMANLVVLAGKGQNHCQKGSTVTVGVADLQDMQNHMRETIDEGLGNLQKNQGQNGIPAAPRPATAPVVQTAYAAIAPPPDPNVATELSAQTREAGQAEQEVLSQGGPDGPNAGADPEPVARPDFRGNCDALESQALGLMQNPPTNSTWRNDLSSPLRQIQLQGFDAYIRDNGGISALMATTREDLATTMAQRDTYGIKLNRAWIDLLNCMSRR
jgi:hypothetical protein